MNLDTLFASQEPEETVDPVKTEPTTEELQEREFEAGLAESLGSAPEETKPEPEAKQEEALRIAGYTEDEIKVFIDKAKLVDDINDRLRQTHDKAFGKLGQLEQELRNMAQTRSTAATPLTKDSFAKLAEYYGDDELVEALAHDLSSLQLGGQAPAFDMDAVKTTFNEQLEQVKQQLSDQFEEKLLTMAHPDWETVKDTEDFAAWQKTLPPEGQQLLFNTNDGMTLIKAFNNFKDWKTKREEAEQQKQQRLLDAMPVVGKGGRATSTADDAFMQGVKSVINKR
jgi:hypothetical protein